VLILRNIYPNRNLRSGKTVVNKSVLCFTCICTNNKTDCVCIANKVYRHNYQKFAHVEHIKAKERYRELQFEQTNLAASCNGFDSGNYSDSQDFCGHIKDRADNNYSFDENLFLHPFEVPNIESYFEYQINGWILPAKDLDMAKQQKAHYMIELLRLNHPILVQMRQKQYTIVRHDLTQGNTTEFIFNNNDNSLPSFISMLKYFFN